MTKSEFETRIDAIMEKHEVRIEAKFDSFETRMDTKFDSMEARFDRQFLKIDNRYNWIIGLTITSVISICGLLFKIMTMVAAH